jgi:hypothetical protein
MHNRKVEEGLVAHARQGLAWTLLPAILIASASGCGPQSASLERVTSDQLCVTEGQVIATPGGALAVTDPKMRATIKSSNGQAIEARFTYNGPTAMTAALGSGEVRRQFGLKLRAADPCNLVYAVWRFAPRPEVVVQVKSNPGAHDSRTCQNHGYVTVKPSRVSPVRAPAPGTDHRLAATIAGALLTVEVDGASVWEGQLGSTALADSGPAGIRSDNAQLTLMLSTSLGGAAGQCGATPED